MTLQTAFEKMSAQLVALHIGTFIAETIAPNAMQGRLVPSEYYVQACIVFVIFGTLLRYFCIE